MRKAKLSLTQVAAAALSAVTVAVLGSQLGAAGTLIGAAGASVITTVGTAVYQASLERSRERVRSLAHRTRSLPLPREGSRTEQIRPASAGAPLRTEQLPDGAGQGFEHQGLDHGLGPRDRARKLAMLRWGALVVGALGAFLLAMMVITGFEVASGQTIGGNGHGTTIAQVVDPPTSPRNPAPTMPPASESSVAPTSEPPSETTSAPDTAASAPTTTAPDASTSPEPSPSNSYGRPEPSGPTPTPPLVPRLPGRAMQIP